MVRRIKKADIAKEISRSTRLPVNTTKNVIDQFLDQVVKSAESGRSVELRGFGTFSRGHRRAQTKRSITGEFIAIDESSTLKFKPGKIVKQRLNYRTP